MYSSISNFIKSNYFVLSILFISLLRITLTSNLPILAIEWSNCDDMLYVRLAESLASGSWLGEYDSLTLVKGPVFAFFLALCNLLNLPFLFGQTLLLVLGCIYLTFAFRKYFSNIYSLIFFVIIVFNPIGWNTESFLRVYRCSIAIPFLAFVIGSVLNSFYNIRKLNIKALIIDLSVCGLFLSLSLNNRDDSVFIIPFVFVSLILSIFIYPYFLKYSMISIKKRISLFLLPFLIVICIKIIISSINYYNYGIFCVSDTSGTYFSKVVKLIYSIQDESNPKHVSASHSKIQKLYDYSNTLLSIKPSLEVCLAAWDQNDTVKGDGEVEDGWFYWCLRSAVSISGHYSSAKNSENFYKAVYRELNHAVENGQLVTGNAMPSALMSPWREEYLVLLPEAFFDAFNYVIDFSGCDSTGSNTLSHYNTNIFIDRITTFVHERALLSKDFSYFISGWILSKSENPNNVAICNENDGVIKKVKFVASPDVYKVYKGSDFKNSDNSRFIADFVIGEEIPYLCMEDEATNQLTKIRLDNLSTFDFEFDTYKIHFDYFEKNSGYYTRYLDGKAKRLNNILSVYRFLTPVLTYTSIVILIILTAYIFLFKHFIYADITIISYGCLGSLFCLLAGVSYTHISAYNAITCPYLSCSYLLINIIIMMPIVLFFKILSSRTTSWLKGKFS